MIGRFWRNHAPKKFREYLGEEKVTASLKAVRQSQLVLAQARQLQLEAQIYSHDSQSNDEHRGTQ